jgi:hypothetical protein
MTIAPDTIYAASVMNAEGTATESVDIRTLNADQLESLNDEAAAAGDASLSAVICMVLAGAEPIRIEGRETIRAMMGDEADETDAEVMLELLRKWGHIVDGFLCITEDAWADFDSEAANLVAANR